MKITPIEIRQHTFEKSMRGYRTDEVEAFLSSLSQEWERVLSEQKMLKMQLELAEKELNKLKEIEMTLFRTLKTAEDTSTQMQEQAQRAAEQYLTETKQKADETLADARKRSTMMVQDAETQARYVRESVENELKSMTHDFAAMERYRDGLITQVRTLASNAMDSIERFEKKFSPQSLQSKIEELVPQVQAKTPDAPATVGDLPDAIVDPTAPPVEAEALDATTVGTTDVDTEVASTEIEADDSDEATDPIDAVNPVLAQASEAGEAGLPAVEPIDEPTSDVPMAEASPQPVSATTEKPRGGSFFDQI